MCFSRKKLVGTDYLGNQYYQKGKQRFIKYIGVNEPTLIPPEWLAWLHNTVENPPAVHKPFFWQQLRSPNYTGTKKAYFPTNYPLKATSINNENAYYQPWKPQ